MKPYLQLLEHVLNTGVNVETRAVDPETGRFLTATSVFGTQTRYPLASYFPLATTKFVNFKAIAHELIWFLNGDTNIKYLNEHGINIWNAWANKKGNLGPIYGAQWRAWPTRFARKAVKIDQIDTLIFNVKRVKEDPNCDAGRRLIVSAWNPAQVSDMAIPPCHTMFQMLVRDGKLSCHLYQRSGDLFLGVPYNVASYAMLTHLVAHVTGLGVGSLVHTIGDAHIYSNHLEQVETQLQRKPLSPPTFKIVGNVNPLLRGLTIDNFSLTDYEFHPSIKGKVAV